MVVRSLITLIAAFLLGSCAKPGQGATDAHNTSPAMSERLSHLPATSVVGTIYGEIAGLNGPVREYRGIPYAAPPVGGLRWAPPQPPKAWNGLFIADKFGPACIQPRAPSVGMSEDCLTLNVWTSAGDSDAGLPVIFWIHGGAFRTGAASDSYYNGDALAAQGAVVVTINYRLGNFGFFAHPELSAENPDQVSGNQGILDIIAALAWVRSNIGAFGGDPENITLWGQSAGATAVGLLTMSPRTEGMFAHAVANSPYGFMLPTSHLKEVRYGRASAESVGAALGDLATLRKMSPEEVSNLRRSDGRYVVDGVIIAKDPTASILDGDLHSIDLLIGSTSDEGASFADKVESREGALAAFEEALGGAAAADIVSRYSVTDERANQSVREFAGDRLIRLGAREIARAASAEGQRVYLYDFSQINGYGDRRGIGAYHAADISYWFGNLPNLAYAGPIQPGEVTPEDADLSSVMNRFLVSFARDGDPNDTGLPRWPAFDPDTQQHLEFNTNAIEPKAHLRMEQLDALRSLYVSVFRESASR